jgi:glucose/arabinose dehydrogenase
MKHFLPVLFFALQLSTALAQPVVPTGFTASLVLENRDPVSFVFDHQGRMFLIEKNGTVLILKGDKIIADSIAVLNVENFSEEGLLGIALDPDFEANHHVYLYYTVAGKNHNRVSRFHFHEDPYSLEDEEILLELDALFGTNHSGGCLKFGPDGKLYIATGNGGLNEVPQSLSSLLGKILRINTDGSIPSDNPFFTTASGKYRAIYAYGFRNPFTFAFSDTGKMYVNDVGEASWEEISDVESGQNYGYPLAEGKISPSVTPPNDYHDPIFSYNHSRGCAVVGAAFYPSSPSLFPAQFAGKYFFGEHCTGEVFVLDPITHQATTFLSNFKTPVGLGISPDGSLYVATFKNAGGKLWKISYSLDGSPRVIIQPKSQIASVGDTVGISTVAVGDGSLSYQWNKDGEVLAGATNDSLVIKSVAIADAGKYSCLIFNDRDSVLTNEITLTVTNRKRPAITWDLSAVRSPYHAGDTINVRASALDEEEGKIPVNRMKFKVEFHHNVHSHPVTDANGQDSISFIVPRIGETSVNVWYRILVTATNNIGLTTTEYRDIYPHVSLVKVESSTPGLVFYLDGKPFQTPFEAAGVAGSSRNISVEGSQTMNDSIYYFKNWGSNEQVSIDFNIADQDTLFQVNFDKGFLGDGTGLLGSYFKGDKVYTNPTYTKIDKTVDLDWGSFGGPEGIGAEHFSIMWTGYMRVPEDATYTFYGLIDDGIQLIIDQEILINDLGYGHSPLELTAQKFLVANKIYPIQVKYWENYGVAKIRLFWSSSTIVKSIVPEKVLFPSYIKPTIDFIDTAPKNFSIGELKYQANAVGAGGTVVDASGFDWKFSLVEGDSINAFNEISETRNPAISVPNEWGTKTQSSIQTRLLVQDRNGFIDSVTAITPPRVSSLRVNAEINPFHVVMQGTELALPIDTTFVAGFTFPLTISDESYVRLINDHLLLPPDSWKNVQSITVNKDTSILFSYADVLFLDDGEGLTADYFSGSKSFTDSPDSTVVDPNVNFKWASDEIPPQGLKVLWRGWIKAPMDGKYHFKTITNGKVKIIAGEDIYISENNTESLSSELNLRRGEFLHVKIYYESTGKPESINLRWYSDVLREHTIPKNQLFSDSFVLAADEDLESKFTPYPNPFNDVLYVGVKYGALDQVKLAMTSASGAIVQVGLLNSATDHVLAINTADMAQGLYILKVSLKGRSQYFKVVKR